MLITISDQENFPPAGPMKDLLVEVTTGPDRPERITGEHVEKVIKTSPPLLEHHQMTGWGH
jgi:hypothetical protein